MSIKDALGTIFPDAACDGAVEEFTQLASVIEAQSQAPSFGEFGVKVTLQGHPGTGFASFRTMWWDLRGP